MLSNHTPPEFNPTPDFNQAETVQLWQQYLAQAEQLCKPLSPRQQNDILTEIKAHILEGFFSETGDEVEKLQSTLARLGNPKDFVPLWVEERLISESAPFTPWRNLSQLLMINQSRGVVQFLLSLLVALGYLISMIFLLTAVFKFVYPENIGFFTNPDGMPIMGYVEGAGFTEHLGYWLVPINLTLGISLQLLLNSLVRRLYT